jgi:hypothetical protein
MAQFVLKINLGNEAMQTGSDVSQALRSIADFIQDNGNMESYSRDNGYPGKYVKDVNGNSIGFWTVE